MSCAHLVITGVQRGIPKAAIIRVAKGVARGDGSAPQAGRITGKVVHSEPGPPLFRSRRSGRNEMAPD